MLSAKSGKHAMSDVRPNALLLISSPGSAYAEDNAGIEGEGIDQKRGKTLGDRHNNKERMRKYCGNQQELRQHELILSQSNHTQSAAVCCFVRHLSFVLQLQRNRHGIDEEKTRFTLFATTFCHHCRLSSHYHHFLFRNEKASTICSSKIGNVL